MDLGYQVLCFPKVYTRHPVAVTLVQQVDKATSQQVDMVINFGKLSKGVHCHLVDTTLNYSLGLALVGI